MKDGQHLRTPRPGDNFDATMNQWAAALSQVAMAAIVWTVILSPALLWALRIRKPATSYRTFRSLIGLLLVIGLVGFAGAHWNAPANDPMPLSVNFANIADARAFSIGLVAMGISFAITSVLELTWTQLKYITRAAVIGADLFLVGIFLGIAVATSGWTASPISKSYWTIGVIVAVLGLLVRALSTADSARSAPSTSQATPA